MSDWRHRAACRDEDPETFFPIGTTGEAPLQIEEAKAVCFGCDVRQTCLRWALNNHIGDGVWGGLTDIERASLRRSISRGGNGGRQIARAARTAVSA